MSLASLKGPVGGNWFYERMEFVLTDYAAFGIVGAAPTQQLVIGDGFCFEPAAE